MKFFDRYFDLSATASVLTARAASAALFTAAAAADAVALDSEVGIGAAIAMTVVAGVIRSFACASSPAAIPDSDAEFSARSTSPTVASRGAHDATAITRAAAALCAGSFSSAHGDAFGTAEAAAAVKNIRRMAGFQPRALQLGELLVFRMVRLAASPPPSSALNTAARGDALGGNAVLQPLAPVGVNYPMRRTTHSGHSDAGAHGGDDSDSELDHLLSNVSL